MPAGAVFPRAPASIRDSTRRCDPVSSMLHHGREDRKEGSGIAGISNGSAGWATIGGLMSRILRVSIAIVAVTFALTGLAGRSAVAHTSTYCGHGSSSDYPWRVDFRSHYTTNLGHHYHYYSHYVHADGAWHFAYYEKRRC